MRILLAEDDSVIRGLLVELLEQEGHECVEAADGRAACELLAKGTQFDVLLSDFRMPRMDGVALLEWCRQSGIHFPVIFITANSELLRREELALGDCCAALLRKPIDLSQLLEALAAATARQHQLDCRTVTAYGDRGSGADRARQ